MHPGALSALEFDRIVEAVGGFALTPLGAPRLAELRPQTDRGASPALQAGTTEAVRFLDDGRRVPAARAGRPRRHCWRHWPSKGAPLEPLRLLGLADFLDLRRGRAAGRPPRRARVSRAQGPRRRRRVVPARGGEVRREDRPAGRRRGPCQPGTAIAARSAAQAARRLRGTLESYLRGKDTAALPAGPDRHRPQRPLRARRAGRAPRADPGHHPRQSSASGASLFLEPLSTVETQQRDRRARGAGGRRGPADPAARSPTLSASRPLDLKRTIEAATELDVLQAKARFARLVDGVEPGCRADGRSSCGRPVIRC